MRFSPFLSVNARGATLPTGIYAIVDTEVSTGPLALLGDMLAAGVRIVQLRAKAGVDRELVRAMHAVTTTAEARLIVNDDFDAALEADGWHGGQEDIVARDLAIMRARLGTRLLGVSCGTPEEARRAEAAGADYVGTGPFAATATKGDAGAPIGEAGLAAVVAAVRIPVVAIGGIDASNLARVAQSGARMAAVISAIARADDPRAMTEQLVHAWAAVR